MKIGYIWLTTGLLLVVLMIAGLNGSSIAVDLLFILKVLFSPILFILGKLFAWLWPIILIVLIFIVIAIFQTEK